MTVLIRRAMLRDVAAVVELAVESVSNNPLPMKVDRVAMGETAISLVQGNQHFAYVAEEDGKIVGALGAATQPGFWHQRMACSVLMFYVRVRGAGIALMREFARWVKGRPAIKLAMVTLEVGMDPRIGKLWKRLGFTNEVPTHFYVRGGVQ